MTVQQDILINWSPQETRVAVVENNAVQELHVERPLARGLVGNVYLGKVARVLPGMQSAFIDIGLERAAFLHVADILDAANIEPAGEAPHPPRAGGSATVPIERQIFEGQALMVSETMMPPTIAEIKPDTAGESEPLPIEAPAIPIQSGSAMSERIKPDVRSCFQNFLRSLNIFI